MEKEKNIIIIKLLFEGEYLDGKRHGKGKEYNNWGDIIFEGEYFYGEKHGKGKRYRGIEIVFEGEYLFGERWNGKGKNIDKNIGPLGIDGEYKNGKFEGRFIDMCTAQ